MAADSERDGISDLLTVFLRLVEGTPESEELEVLASAVASSCERLLLELLVVFVAIVGEVSLERDPLRGSDPWLSLLGELDRERALDVDLAEAFLDVLRPLEDADFGEDEGEAKAVSWSSTLSFFLFLVVIVLVNAEVAASLESCWLLL